MRETLDHVAETIKRPLTEELLLGGLERAGKVMMAVEDGEIALRQPE